MNLDDTIKFRNLSWICLEVNYYVVAFALLLNFISQSALTPFINLVYSATNLLNDILYQLNCCFNLFFISNVHNKHEFILIHS